MSRIKTFNLFGEILPRGGVGNGFAPEDVIDELVHRTPEGAYDVLRFNIDSTGGDYVATKQIVRAIQNRPERTEANVVGLAYSGAFIIAMSCERRVACMTSTLMMHGVSTGRCFHENLLDTAEVAAFLGNEFRRYYSGERILCWLTHGSGSGVYFSGGDAVTRGFFDDYTLETPRRREPIPWESDIRRHDGHSGRYQRPDCDCGACLQKRAGASFEPD